MKYLAIYLVNTDQFSSHDSNNFNNSISEFETISIEKWDESLTKEIAWKEGKVATVGFGRLVSDKITLYFFALPGPINIQTGLPPALIYDKQHNINILSYIMLIDVKYYVFRAGHNLLDLETRTFKPYPEGHLYVEMAKEQIADFRKIVPDAHYIVAVVNHDDEKAMPLEKLHDALDIPPSIKLIPCDTTDKASVKNVLLELLKSQEQTDDVKEAIRVIEKQ